MRNEDIKKLSAEFLGTAVLVFVAVGAAIFSGQIIVGALAFGLLTNFWFWPFVGSDTTYSFVPGASVATNLHRFILFDLTTSMGFDITRAVTCAVLILVLGRPVLAALRRAARRAAFEPEVEFIG